MERKFIENCAEREGWGSGTPSGQSRSDLLIWVLSFRRLAGDLEVAIKFEIHLPLLFPFYLCADLSFFIRVFVLKSLFFHYIYLREAYSFT